MSWSQNTYSRNYSSPQVGRDSSLPRFHLEPVKDEVASAAAGRSIFIQQERVQIIQPGNPNQPVFLVTDEHREKWPEQYAAFKRGQEQTGDGTPLEQWPVLSRAQVLEMKAIGLHTVEQCAGLSDLAIQKIGMGGQKIRDLAMSYLDDAEQQALTTAALDRAEKAEGRVAGLEKQVAELRTLLDQVHGDLMNMRNQPSAIETYVPGLHDPMQPHNQAIAAPSGSASSLDALMEPRKRGRPPVNRAA